MCFAGGAGGSVLCIDLQVTELAYLMAYLLVMWRNNTHTYTYTYIHTHAHTYTRTHTHAAALSHLHPGLGRLAPEDSLRADIWQRVQSLVSENQPLYVLIQG